MEPNNIPAYPWSTMLLQLCEAESVEERHILSRDILSQSVKLHNAAEALVLVRNRIRYGEGSESEVVEAMDSALHALGVYQI